MDTYNNLMTINEFGEELISLEEAKEFLKISGTNDDNLITKLITLARRQGENICGKALIEKICAATYLKYIPAKDINYLKLPYDTVESIISINSHSNGITELINESTYSFSNESQLLFLKKIIYADSIEIKFKTQISNLDSGIQYALLSHINLLYKKRLPKLINNEHSVIGEVYNLYNAYRLKGL